MNLNFHIASDIGGRNQNQDYYGSDETKFGVIFIVCDGIGGSNGGEIASKLAVKTTLEQLHNSTEIDPSKALISAIQYANSIVWNQSNQKSDLKGMGTTIVALLINNEKAISCHVGDSRIYLIRKGKIVFRTEDHSRVYELAKRGIITEEQARLSEESNIILRSIGTKNSVKVAINDDLSFEIGDRFILCSDGVSGSLPESMLIKLINQKKPSQDLTKEVIHTINKIGFENGGGHDNLTVAIIDIEFNSKLKPKMKMKTKIALWVSLSLLFVSLVLNVLQFGSIISPHFKVKNSINRDTTFLKQLDIQKEYLNKTKQKDSSVKGVIPIEKLFPELNRQNDSSKIPRNLK
jgi:serine/threonine protein phosphatase PrpC